MVALDYAALRATPVATDPFSHVVVPGFVPPTELSAIFADLPALSRRGSFPIRSLQLGPRAEALIAELEGATFREAVAGALSLICAAPRPWSPCAGSPPSATG